MKPTRKSGSAVLFVMALSTCLAILLAKPVAYAQEKQTVLKPNQLMTFSLAPGQERVFELPMKRGDFAGIELLAPEGVNVSLGIYDPARKELLEEPIWGEDSLWFVAQTDGDFVFVITLEKDKNSPISDAQRISVQYNNKFRLPVRTKQEDIRRINGYDIKIMRTPGDYAESKSVVLIEKNRQLKRVLVSSGGDPKGFSFPYPDRISKPDPFASRREILLINSTPDKTGDGIPDVMIRYFFGGAHCCMEMYFINLGETVQTVDVLGMADGQEAITVDKNPNGGLLFRTGDGWGYWNTNFATSPVVEVILEFKNGKLRPNFNLMKKPAPSLAVLKNKAEFYRQRLSLKPYRGDVEDYDAIYRDDTYPDNRDVTYKGTVLRNVVFWGPMLDLIYTGHEDLAWQFLDLVWPPQKQGKELFIRDFKNQLAKSEWWQKISEDKQK